MSKQDNAVDATRSAPPRLAPTSLRAGDPRPRSALGSRQVPDPAARSVAVRARGRVDDHRQPHRRPVLRRGADRDARLRRGSSCSLGLEVLRQLHYLIEEHSRRTTGSGRRRCSAAGTSGSSKHGRLDPVPRRPRVQVLRLPVRPQHASWGASSTTEPVWLGMLEAPARLVAALPFVFQLVVRLLLHHRAVRRAVLVPVARRHRHVHARRPRDAVLAT